MELLYWLVVGANRVHRHPATEDSTGLSRHLSHENDSMRIINPNQKHMKFIFISRSNRSGTQTSVSVYHKLHYNRN